MDRANPNGSVFSLICDNGERGIEWSLGSERHSLCKVLDIEWSQNYVILHSVKTRKNNFLSKILESWLFLEIFVCLSFLKSIGIPQAEILERIAMPSSMGSSQPRDQTQVSWIADRFFIIWASRKVHTHTHTYTHTHTKDNKREELLPSWLNFLNVT